MAVSWTIGTSPNAELANSMLRRAIDTLKSTEHSLIHSDYIEENTIPKFLVYA